MNFKDIAQKVLLITTTFGLISTSAQTLASDMLRAYPEPFIGLKGGYQIATDEDYRGSDPKRGLVGVYGGLQFSKEWSWDLGYQFHEKLEASVTGTNVSTSLFESAIRYDWYLQDNLSIYSRLGASYWDMDKTYRNVLAVDGKGFSPLAELGVNYHVTPNVRLSAGYQYIDAIGNSKTGKYDSHALLVSLSYNFGWSSKPTVTLAKPEDAIPAKSELQPVIISTLPKVYKFDKTSVSLVFGFDKARLVNTKNLAQLSLVTKHLSTYPQAQVEIIGHTDITGPKAYNQKLSELRARFIATALKNNGVSGEQMTVRWKGASSPIASNSAKEGRAKNRRVEIVLLPFEYKKELDK